MRVPLVSTSTQAAGESPSSAPTGDTDGHWGRRPCHSGRPCVVEGICVACWCSQLLQDFSTPIGMECIDLHTRKHDATRRGGVLLGHSSDSVFCTVVLFLGTDKAQSETMISDDVVNLCKFAEAPLNGPNLIACSMQTQVRHCTALTNVPCW